MAHTSNSLCISATCSVSFHETDCSSLASALYLGLHIFLKFQSIFLSEGESGVRGS